MRADKILLFFIALIYFSVLQGSQETREGSHVRNGKCADRHDAFTGISESHESQSFRNTHHIRLRGDRQTIHLKCSRYCRCWREDRRSKAHPESEG